VKEFLLIALFSFMLFEVPLGLDVNLAPGLSIKNAFLYILLVAIVIQASAVNKAFRISLLSLHSIFIALIAYIAISWAISATGHIEIDYPIFGSFILLKTTVIDQYMFMFVYLYALTSHKQVLYVARALVWVVVISSFLTLIDLLNIPDLGIFEEDKNEGRVQGPVGQPNRYGGFLAFWIPVCVGTYWTGRTSGKIVIGVGILCSVGLLILTGSRGAIVGTVAGSMLAIVFLGRYLPTRMVVRRALSAVVVAAAILLVVSFQFTDMVEDRFERTISDDVSTVTAGRFDIWSEALSKMWEHPASFVYGNGWNSFDLTMVKTVSAPARQTTKSAHTSAHNMYLRLLFELGGIGLALYLGLLYVTIRHIRSGIQSAQGISKMYLVATVFAICAISVSTMFSEVSRTWMMIWAYTGLMLRLALISRSDAKDYQSAI